MEVLFYIVISLFGVSAITAIVCTFKNRMDFSALIKDIRMKIVDLKIKELEFNN